MPNRWEQIITSLYGQRFGFNHEGDLVVDGATVATFKRDTAGQIVGLLNTDGTSIILPIVLAQSAIPFVLPSSGTFTGGTGALSAITALPATYSGGCFMYFPAGAGLPQGAGWYWTIMSSTTAGTVYNNVYSSGDPKTASPGYAAAGTAITSGATSYTQGTSEVTATQITLPGGSLGPSGQIHWSALAGANNAAGNRTVRFKLGGTTMFGHNLASVPAYGMYGIVANAGSQARQYAAYGAQGFIGTAGAITDGTINTAVDATLAVTMQLPAATDTLVLQYQSIEIRYGV